MPYQPVPLDQAVQGTPLPTVPPCRTCAFFLPSRRIHADGTSELRYCHHPSGPERDFSCYTHPEHHAEAQP